MTDVPEAEHDEHNPTNTPHPLLRDPSAGMHPVSLLTGFVGPRGERIRHPVHEGALRLPSGALDIICNDDDVSKRTKKEYTLPALDSVLRPSLDPALPSFTVTEVRNEEIVQEEVSPEDGTIQTTKYTKVVSNTRVIVRPPSNTTDDVAIERIRGGGPGEGGDAVTPSAPSDPNIVPAAAMVAANPLAPVVPTSIVGPSESGPTPMDVGVGTSPSAGAAIAAPLPPQQAPIAKPAEMAPLVPNTSVPSTVVVAPVVPTSSLPPPTNVPTTTTITPKVAGSMVPAVPPRQVPIVAPPQLPVHAPNMATPAVVPPVAVPSQHLAAAVPPPKATLSTSETARADPQVIPLAKRPLELWESQKSPDAATAAFPSKGAPDWYAPTTVSSLERAALSEWFDGSAAHRTPESYMQSREKVIAMSRSMGPQHFLTGTLVRRTIPGDIGSLLRLHAFLTTNSLINADALNESTPTPAVLLKPAPVQWNDEAIRTNLMHAVVEQTRKRPKIMPSEESFISIDWEAVAKSVGSGVTSAECERQFLTMSIPSTKDGSVTPDPTEATAAVVDPQDRAALKAELQEELLTDLVRHVDPAVLSAVTNAAFRCTNGISQAQQGGRIGLLAHAAAEQTRLKERNVARVMAEIVDLRMQKLEQRLSCLDEVEGMLEAERVALELERRDLYTARCRHWFGGT